MNDLESGQPLLIVVVIVYCYNSYNYMKVNIM